MGTQKALQASKQLWTFIKNTLLKFWSAFTFYWQKSIKEDDSLLVSDKISQKVRLPSSLFNFAFVSLRTENRWKRVL